MQHPSVKTEGHILRHAPVAAGSVDTPEFEKHMVRWSTAGGGRFGLHEQGIPELRTKIVAHIDAWGAQQREAGKQEAIGEMMDINRRFLRRSEKAEARVKEMEAESAHKQAIIDRLMLEHCPDEMTAEQVKEWGNRQVRAPAGIVGSGPNAKEGDRPCWTPDCGTF